MTTNTPALGSWKITVDPGILPFEEYLKFFKDRKNYDRWYTDYTFFNEYSARHAKTIYENMGYTVILYDPFGEKADATNHGIIHGGLVIKAIEKK